MAPAKERVKLVPGIVDLSRLEIRKCRASGYRNMGKRFVSFDVLSYCTVPDANLEA